MASIKTLLKEKAIEIFWKENVAKVTKKDKTYTVYLYPYWNTNHSDILFDIRRWVITSWDSDVEETRQKLIDFEKKWSLFENEAAKINSEFIEWHNDSDRWFVPHNYLFYEIINR